MTQTARQKIYLKLTGVISSSEGPGRFAFVRGISAYTLPLMLILR